MADDASAPAPAQAGNSKAVSLIAAVIFLVAVVLVEVGVAFFVFPSKEDIAALATSENQAADGEANGGQPEAMSLSEGNSEHLAEIALGEFGVSSYQPLTNTTLRIDFELYGIVAEDDASSLEGLLQENRHRFREGVIVIMRSAELTDFTDAGLGLIKRKILEKTNRTLGRAVLRDVVFSDFSFIEQ